eukprot:jgi/Ulvmu1/7689/UM038_0121.1
MAGYDGHDIATVLAYVITLIISYGSQAGLFGKTNADISKLNQTPLTPAGFTFAIWGLIFLGQGISVIYLMYRPQNASDKQSIVKSVCIWWVFGWAAESLWQYLFQLQSKASLIACAIVLIAATYAFSHSYRNALALRPAITDFAPASLAKHVIVASSAMNAAWLTVAASVAVLIALNVAFSLRLMPFAIAAAAIITVLGAGVIGRTQGWVYGATLVWAFWGVAAKQHGTVIHTISLAAMAVLGLLSVVAVVQLARTRSSGASSPLLG